MNYDHKIRPPMVCYNHTRGTHSIIYWCHVVNLVVISRGTGSVVYWFYIVYWYHVVNLVVTSISRDTRGTFWHGVHGSLWSAVTAYFRYIVYWLITFYTSDTGSSSALMIHLFQTSDNCFYNYIIVTTECSWGYWFLWTIKGVTILIFSQHPFSFDVEVILINLVKGKFFV